MSYGCEECENYIFDDEIEEYACDAWMDEDDYGRLASERRTVCPYFRFRDEYRVVRKQSV
ncbi:MAG: hypothetical protein IJT16_02215 [Lachnospiraceae bacterium]|nr:hypothetical protein [Lachnospiraceae bacterium]